MELNSEDEIEEIEEELPEGVRMVREMQNLKEGLDKKLE